MSSSTGCAVSTLWPKSPVSTFCTIDQELLPERQVEPHLEPHPLVDRRRRPVADGGQHRVDRHDPADQEGDEQEPEEGQRQGGAELHQGAAWLGMRLRAPERASLLSSW